MEDFRAGGVNVFDFLTGLVRTFVVFLVVDEELIISSPSKRWGGLRCLVLGLELLAMAKFGLCEKNALLT